MKKSKQKRKLKITFWRLIYYANSQTNNLKNTEKVCISIKSNYNIILNSEKKCIKNMKICYNSAENI